MAEDVTQDASDDFVTVNDETPVEPAASSDSVVDPEVPPAEPAPVPQHDPNVKIPDDNLEELVADPQPVPDANVSPIAKSGPGKGTFRGHDVVAAERQANEDALVALRVDPVEAAAAAYLEG